MRKQVITYVAPAAEIRQGDRILTNRMTLAEVESSEAFKDSSGRPCIEVCITKGAQKSTTVFVADESVLVFE